MKEATGELNATVVVVIIVALLAAFFYYAIWPVLDKNMEKNSKCSKAYCENCYQDPGQCQDTDGDGTYDLVKCYYEPNKQGEITCPFKG